MESYLSKNITSAATTVVSATGCILHTIVVNKSNANYIQFKNGSITLGTLKADVGERTYKYDIACPAGLTVITDTGYAGDVTVSYSIQGS